MTGDEDAGEPCRPSSSRETMSKDEEKETARLIKEHPLFPVLELLINKCDKATRTLTSDDGKTELMELFRELEEKNVSPVTGNDEVDQLVQNAILVLRTNIVELTKVSDLSRMFRTKYLQSIKKTMNQESMIGLVADSDDDLSPETPSTAFGLNAESFSNYGLPNFENFSDTFALMNSTNNAFTLPFQFLSFQHQFHTVSSSSPTSNNTSDIT